MDDIREQINESIQVKSALLEKDFLTIKAIVTMIVNSFKKGHHLYLMGNGGSAADAQHIAGELVGRYKNDRKPLPAMAFTTDTSILTAIANDYGYNYCFVKQVEAFVKEGDTVIGISTSGRSINIINAIKRAKELGASTIAFTGAEGGSLKDYADICLLVPSTNTPRIQEAHITIAHIICSIIEKEMFEFE